MFVTNAQALAIIAKPIIARTEAEEAALDVFFSVEAEHD